MLRPAWGQPESPLQLFLPSLVNMRPSSESREIATPVLSVLCVSIEYEEETAGIKCRSNRYVGRKSWSNKNCKYVSAILDANIKKGPNEEGGIEWE